MTTSLLEQELAQLNAQIEQVTAILPELEGELRATEAELESHSEDRQRFDALREACNVLDRLDALQAGNLFWGEVQVKDRAAHVEELRSRVAVFDEKIRGVLEKQAHLKAQIDQRRDELDYLYDDVDSAHAREERRLEEFLVERELSAVPDHELIMPWSHDGEVERRYRRTMSTAMFLSLIMMIIVRLVHVPAPVHPVVMEVPERLAMMVRKERPKPLPVKPKEHKDEKKEAKNEEKKPEKAAEKKEAKKQAVAQEKPAQARPKPAPVEQTAAPKRSQNTGVLAFKESFKDILDETPTPKLGVEARLSNPATYGSGQASRSLVAMAGGRGGSGTAYAALSRNAGNGGSGGIGSAAVNRSVGGSGGNGARLGRGDAGVAKVKSGIPGGGSKDGRPLSSGARPSRTDEEIQILFDRYKAALYRIYNMELRKDPTLRGKMVLRISIEPSGVVSACGVESCNMNAPEFNEQIVERVRKFNFGPKEGVPKTTILYPIDFLPAR